MPNAIKLTKLTKLSTILEKSWLVLTHVTSSLAPRESVLPLTKVILYMPLLPFPSQSQHSDPEMLLGFGQVNSTPVTVHT